MEEACALLASRFCSENTNCIVQVGKKNYNVTVPKYNITNSILPLDTPQTYNKTNDVKLISNKIIELSQKDNEEDIKNIKVYACVGGMTLGSSIQHNNNKGSVSIDL